MTLNELHKILLQGESDTVEFKSSFNTQTIETLVAFANLKGGTVYIGVSDIGEITGVSVNSETLQQWINEIKTKTEPSIISDTDVIKIKEKTVIKISISEFPVKPVAVKGRYYIRKNNSNHLLSPNEISDIYLQSMQLSWDSYVFPRAEINQLDNVKIRKFIHKVNEISRFHLNENNFNNALAKLGLIKGNKPTNASMLLFSKINRDYNIHIGRFKSPTYIISDKLISGTLYEVLDESMQTIISHLKFAFEITGKTTQRIEIPDYPLKAIRELLINAIVHRDYKSPVDIQIRIYDQSITFFNPGKLYGDLTIADLLSDKYQSRTRNKLVAEAFYLTGDIEKYGSGYQRIREEIAQYPTMKLNFKEIGDGFWGELSYLKQKISTIISTDVGKDATDNVSENVTENVTDNDTDNVTDRKSLIISLIQKNNKITTAEIASKLKVTKRTILREIELLKKTGLLKREGKEKNGHWEVIQ